MYLKISTVLKYNETRFKKFRFDSFRINYSKFMLKYRTLANVAHDIHNLGLNGATKIINKK